MLRFLILDLFPEPELLKDEDEIVREFNSLEDAMKVASEEATDPQILDLINQKIIDIEHGKRILAATDTT